MPTIRQLSQSVINKIAAGEVIERPASVVKELVENAVDAGSTRVDVTLEQGGLELIRVADNGCGISPEQFPLAVASHATSKILDADDLFRVQTLGFRGEALASIAEISHLLLRSRTTESPAGAELEVTGGTLSDVVPCGCPVGTILEIRNLFFNTPVRRKFLRSSSTEFGHCSEAFTRIALAYPAIHMTLRHQGRVVYDLPPTVGWRDRIATFFGTELASDLIWVEGDDEAAKVSGYVAPPAHSRANNRLQYLFLNGRYIRDRSLQHALGEAYRGLLLTGRFPIAFLRLELRPDAVDVNVHPTKLEVRFEDSGRVYSQLLGTLRNRFLSTDLTAKVQTQQVPAGPAPDSAPSRSSPPAAISPSPVSAAEADQVFGGPSLDRQQAERHREEMARWARGSATPPPQQAKFEFQPQPAWRPLPEFQPFPDRSTRTANIPDHDAEELPRPDTASPPPVAAHPVTSRVAEVHSPHAPSAPHVLGLARGLQIQNRYIVTESEEGLVVIDQHALHERILYEQLRERLLAGRPEVQRLLVPEPVRLIPAEAAAVLESRELLLQLGMEVEPFGGDTVLIAAYPAMLANLSPGEILRQVVELLMSGGKTPERRDLLDELLHMIACKAAIKAGDRLAVEEIHTLLEERHRFQDSHHCPHGRPTTLVFSREELDRRFLRT